MPYSVLMIASTSFFSDYGCHVRILEEIQALERLGHRIVLATYHNGDDIPGIDTRRSWDVPWIKRAMVGSSRHKLYLDVGLSWRSLRVALAMRPDLIHAHTHEAGLIGVVLKRLLGIPMVLDYQGSMTSEMLDHRFLSKSSPLYLPLTKLERMINHWSDAIVTSTHNAAALLRSEGIVDPHRLHTVIDSVNTERFRPPPHGPAAEAERKRLRESLGIPEGRRIVVYLGLLAPYQGTNILLQAAQQLIPRMPDVHFLIMGYPDPASYHRYAEALGIADHVTLPGRILYRDAHAYLSLGEVAVAPKMSMTEGSGKISNYMAMGLPVVTFDTPVSREILGDIGVYAALGDVNDLAAKLETVLEDASLAERLGISGRQRAIADFSWEQSARNIDRIYHDLVQGNMSTQPTPPSEEPHTHHSQEHIYSK